MLFLKTVRLEHAVKITVIDRIIYDGILLERLIIFCRYFPTVAVSRPTDRWRKRLAGVCHVPVGYHQGWEGGGSGADGPPNVLASDACCVRPTGRGAPFRSSSSSSSSSRDSLPPLVSVPIVRRPRACAGFRRAFVLRRRQTNRVRRHRWMVRRPLLLLLLL